MLWNLGASYLVLTLCSTSLAKVCRWRLVTCSFMRERVVPARLAPFAVWGVVAAECALATMIAVRFAARITGVAVAVLYFIFGAYRLASAMRSKALTCTCAGRNFISPLSVRSVVATVISLAMPAALAIGWADIGGHTAAGRYDWMPQVALGIPWLLFIARGSGLLRLRRSSAA